MSNPENRIENTFTRCMDEVNKLEKAFQPGKGLEKAVMDIGGDPSYLKDVAEALSNAYEMLEAAHYGAMGHMDDEAMESLSKKKKITNKTPVGMVAEGILDGDDEDGFMARSQLYFLARDAITLHGIIKDQEDLEPWVQSKIAQSSKDIDAVRRYTEYNAMEQDVEPQMSPDMGDENLPAVMPQGPEDMLAAGAYESAESVSASEYALISYPDTSISYIRKTAEGGWEHIFDRSYGYEGSVANADLKHARPIPLGKIPERMHDSALQEDWESMKPIDKDRYQERDGLEGPFMTRIGKVVYYDPREGSYYDPDSDIYITYEDWKEMDLPNAPLRNEGSGGADNIDTPKMEVTQADKNANTPAWQRYKAGDPAYVFKNIAQKVSESKAGDKFKPHMMYDPKTGKGKMCKVEADHLELKKKGWGHDKPKAKDIKEDFGAHKHPHHKPSAPDAPKKPMQKKPPSKPAQPSPKPSVEPMPVPNKPSKPAVPQPSKPAPKDPKQPTQPKKLKKKGFYDKPVFASVKEGMAFDEKRTGELKVVAKDMFKNALANAKKKAGN